MSILPMFIIIPLIDPFPAHISLTPRSPLFLLSFFSF